MKWTILRVEKGRSLTFLKQIWKINVPDFKCIDIIQIASERNEPVWGALYSFHTLSHSHWFVKVVVVFNRFYSVFSKLRLS